jgi:hypothetical protein
LKRACSGRYIGIDDVPIRSRCREKLAGLAGRQAEGFESNKEKKRDPEAEAGRGGPISHSFFGERPCTRRRHAMCM